MPLFRPPLLPLSLDVADCVFDGTIIKQKVHRVDVHITLGGANSVRLGVYVSAYAQAADGSYGDPLPADRVPVRMVPLNITPTAAVTQQGIVRYRQRTPTQVVDAAGVETELPEGQDWLGFLDAQEEVLLLQDEWLMLVRDTQEVIVREFVERFIGLADVAPSAFV